MSARDALALAGLAGLAAAVGVGLAGLPAPGRATSEMAAAIASTAVQARHATDVVAAVTFDYRGFDTIGEELMLLAASVGVELLLRPLRDEQLKVRRAARLFAPLPSAATRWAARQAGVLALVVGIALAAHGHLTPGGGFQGGVAIGAAALCVYLASHLPGLRGVVPDHHAATAEGAGAAAFVLLGGLSIWKGGAYLENVLPLGTPGTLLSSGTILVANLAVGLAVGGAFATVLKEFLEQAVGEGRGP